jgi:hypothetical protein
MKENSKSEMKTKYFICIRPQFNDSHAVHKEDCPCLPAPEKRIFLGIFQSPDEAVKEGKKHFPAPAGCRFCSREYYKENSKILYFERSEKSDFLTSDRLMDTLENALICSMN